MSTKIADENFPKPDVINAFPCLTADRFLHKVDESVLVSRCCIDPQDTNLVIVDFSLVGAFYFTPYLKILKLDDVDIEPQMAPIIASHPLSADIPINTNCTTFHGQLVFDFSYVIQNFLSVRVIEFELGMVGTVPQAFGVVFPSQTPTHIFRWQKGLLVKPLNLRFSNGTLLLEFYYDGVRDCACNVQCTIPSGVSHDVLFCPDMKQELVLYNGELNGSPQDILVQFRDSIGNLSSLNIQGIIGVDPVPPVVSKKADPKRVEVSINRRAIDGTLLENIDYQVLRYEGSNKNYTIWKDWSHRLWDTFIDTDILTGKTYGYSVRYKGKFGDISEISSWATVIA